MRTLSDTQKKILSAEFPGMSFEGDPDIERYFELRSRGMQSDALALYNTRLRRKYPDDAKRAELLRCYRSHDPHYRELLGESMVVLAERALSRATGIISLLTRDIDSVDMTDAYSVIKLAEGLLAFISPDRYAAIAFTERYARYATILSFRQRQMERTAELIRLYVTDTVASVEEMKKERAERKRQSAKRERLGKASSAPSFDLSRVAFTADDVTRIVIPSSIVKIEDKVIAYCAKYWDRYTDIAFEKTIFLYSRKYGTKHSDIYQAVKNGRTHGWKDEETLNAVLANVVTGYYYSITGDLYLQRAWARYKLGAELTSIVAPALPEPELPTPRKRQRRVSIGKPKGRIVPFKPAKTAERAAPIAPVTAIPSVAPVKAKKRSKPVIVATSRAFVPNSIADIIKKHTGKTYTVYKDLFFMKIRPSIRSVLASSATKKGDVFGKRQNEAEELVYRYLYAHYADPYQDWDASDDRKKLGEIGYPIPSIETVIDHWIKTTNGRESSARA
jgi:hypothetical protein